MTLNRQIDIYVRVSRTEYHKMRYAMAPSQITHVEVNRNDKYFELEYVPDARLSYGVHVIADNSTVDWVIFL